MGWQGEQVQGKWKTERIEWKKRKRRNSLVTGIGKQEKWTSIEKKGSKEGDIRILTSFRFEAVCEHLVSLYAYGRQINRKRTNEM